MSRLSKIHRLRLGTTPSSRHFHYNVGGSIRARNLPIEAQRNSHFRPFAVFVVTSTVIAVSAVAYTIKLNRSSVLDRKEDPTRASKDQKQRQTTEGSSDLSPPKLPVVEGSNKTFGRRKHRPGQWGLPDGPERFDMDATDDNVATYLARNALGGKDHDTISALLTLPLANARRFR